MGIILIKCSQEQNISIQIEVWMLSTRFDVNIRRRIKNTNGSGLKMSDYLIFFLFTFLFRSHFYFYRFVPYTMRINYTTKACFWTDNESANTIAKLVRFRASIKERENRTNNTKSRNNANDNKKSTYSGRKLQLKYLLEFCFSVWLYTGYASPIDIPFEQTVFNSRRI